MGPARGKALFYLARPSIGDGGIQLCGRHVSIQVDGVEWWFGYVEVVLVGLLTCLLIEFPRDLMWYAPCIFSHCCSPTKTKISSRLRVCPAIWHRSMWTFALATVKSSLVASHGEVMDVVSRRNENYDICVEHVFVIRLSSHGMSCSRIVTVFI